MTLTVAPTPIAERLAALRTAITALPHEDDIATPRERERVLSEWNRLTRRHTLLDSAVARIAKLGGRLAPVREWREHLLGAEEALTAELVALEALPPSFRREKWRREEAVRASLKALHFGVEYLGSMVMLPTPLAEALRARGVVPEHGQESIWTGRGSLTVTDDRIAELEGQIRDAQAVIDAELGAAV